MLFFLAIGVLVYVNIMQADRLIFICPSMIARCFHSVNYPILPIIKADNNDQVRDFRLFLPADFDYYPYFTVIKLPVWG
jgi:hypothetical protein